MVWLLVRPAIAVEVSKARSAVSRTTMLFELRFAIWVEVSTGAWTVVRPVTWSVFRLAMLAVVRARTCEVRKCATWSLVRAMAWLVFRAATLPVDMPPMSAVSIAAIAAVDRLATCEVVR